MAERGLKPASSASSGALPAEPVRPRGLAVVRVPLRGGGGRAAVWGAVGVLVVMGAAAVFAPWLAPQDPIATDTTAVSLPPGSPGHPLGTDDLGRDLCARMLFGARSSLLVGLVAGVITVVAGTALGALAAAGPRWLDAAVTRTADALLALPLIVVALALAAVAGASLTTVVLAIVVTAWMPVALIARAEIRALRERPFVRAAYSLGLSRGRVFLRHLVPNALPPIASIAAFEVGHAILTESTLSFLGLGVPPNRPSWGNLLTDARSHLLSGQWYTVALPAAAIVVTIIAVNVIATGLDRHEAAEGRTW
ncbi:peptide/nickel transport system permease protein [Spinactinospora alkalitolerans]|uniref:Peptide/nickel transport system permease protein n=1 Tax=Spinactinospora alkalitolerans TaxID=687207 RepID=A0A852TP48_9ACTN|nr:ABC transporter permease [Spinactinospora alkalitolerans]NYE45067.1 peptide/nickel transport system permease protein [Spinactinospora alkalitolerans]